MRPPTSVLHFFLLVFTLTVPFWVVGAVTGIQLLPGVPLAALAVVCPLLGALILVYREKQTVGVNTLLARSFDFKRITPRVWWLPLLLLLPAVAIFSFTLMRANGVAVPEPQVGIVPTLALLGACFVAAWAEELGWSGYAVDLMQSRWHALLTGVLLGSAWSVWHFVPLLQAHRALSWIAWWSVGTVALRIVMVWLYNNAGKSVFAATLFHTLSNVCWQSFPIHGSYFDPRINGLIMAGIAAIIALGWGSRTLTGRVID